MSFRAFVFACETLRLQQQERFHVETPVEREPTPGELRERNAESVRTLQAFMGGVKR
jgi:hypothetical protein